MYEIIPLKRIGLFELKTDITKLMRLLNISPKVKMKVGTYIFRNGLIDLYTNEGIIESISCRGDCFLEGSMLIIQFYSALRNEQKPVWMLEYTDANHGVLGESGLDFSKKMSQFFNHFLKNQKMPDWMLP